MRKVANEVFWRKDGTSLPVEYTAVPIDEAGEVTGAVVTFRDITERLAIERAKDEFVSMVSHDLRTPLTSVRGSLGLLASGLLGPVSEKAQRMAEVALSNTDRLIRLINDILDLQRIDSGRVPMEARPTDARELVLRSIESVESVATAAQIEVVERAERVPAQADHDRLVQTLTNLLGNALKFSPPGSRIEVGARQDGTNVLFSVRDQGRGIPEEKLESIFGRFGQVDASDAREKGGTGLGLAISKSIVQQHGGQIWVESVVGQGSTFQFTIPLAAARTVVPVVDSGAYAPAILICDDDPDLLEVIGEMLAHRGYRPIGVQSGEEAVQRAAAEQPAAILLDLAMPGMNGWETLVELKRHAETLHDTIDRVLARHIGLSRALVIEDDEDLARVLGDTFAERGIETEHANTGERAIAISRRLDPDVLVLNLEMPDRDRFKVVDWFRQQGGARRAALVVYTPSDLNVDERNVVAPGTADSRTNASGPPAEMRLRVLALLEQVVPVPSRTEAS